MRYHPRVMSLPIRLHQAVRLALVTGALCALSAHPASAQVRERLPLFVVDLQGTLPKFPTHGGFSGPRGLGESQLPAWGPGVNVGGQVFFKRGTKLSFGVGATYVFTRGTKSPEPAEGKTVAEGPTVTTKYAGLMPQVSINFGHRLGWSYISGGLGQSTLTINRDDAPEEVGAGTRTINYGGGARWFMKDHLAFSIDLRFFAVNPVDAGIGAYGHPRKTMLIFSAGVSFQ